MSSPSNFDPIAFLASSVTESNDTVVIPVPVGEYTGIVEKVTPRTWQSKDGSQSGIALDIMWLVEDAGVKAELGRDKVTCKQGIMLDLTTDGRLDMSKGRNIGLGRLREAVGLNTPGQAFSFEMLPGQAAKISISHRVTDDNVFAEVKGVTKL